MRVKTYLPALVWLCLGLLLEYSAFVARPRYTKRNPIRSTRPHTRVHTRVTGLGSLKGVRDDEMVEKRVGVLGGVVDIDKVTNGVVNGARSSLSPPPVPPSIPPVTPSAPAVPPSPPVPLSSTPSSSPTNINKAALSAIAEAASQGVEIPDSESLTEIERAARNALGLNEKDALSGDFSAAFSMPVSPLPFTLPQLTNSQKEQLERGERVQEQSDMKREGKGFVVVDVKAPPKDVWDVLLDFESYPKTIPTVRKMNMFTNTRLKEPYYQEKPVQKEDFLNGKIAKLKYSIPSVTRAAFVLSKFRLNIAAIHKYRPHPGGHYMVFTLDPACTNMVLKSAKGVWHTQANPEGKEGYTRVWLLCEVKVSRALPSFITDYAAKRAMPRATQWLKPAVEAASQLWLKEKTDEGETETENT